MFHPVKQGWNKGDSTAIELVSVNWLLLLLSYNQYQFWPPELGWLEYKSVFFSWTVTTIYLESIADTYEQNENLSLIIDDHHHSLTTPILKVKRDQQDPHTHTHTERHQSPRKKTQLAIFREWFFLSGNMVCLGK